MGPEDQERDDAAAEEFARVIAEEDGHRFGMLAYGVLCTE